MTFKEWRSEQLEEGIFDSMISSLMLGIDAAVSFVDGIPLKKAIKRVRKAIENDTDAKNKLGEVLKQIENSKQEDDAAHQLWRHLVKTNPTMKKLANKEDDVGDDMLKLAIRELNRVFKNKQFLAKFKKIHLSNIDETADHRIRG